MRLRRSVVVAAALLLAGAPGRLAPAPRALAAAPTPTIASIVPDHGSIAGGTTVTITGTQFRDTLTVTFDGVPATDLVIVSSTTLTVKTPPRSVKGRVNVVVRHQNPPPLPPEGADPTLVTLENGFHYLAPPAYVWVARADGIDTGVSGDGPDVAIVDTVNERVAGALDLNAGDPDLVGDLQWEPTQILFDADGKTAFIATQGTVGARDSRKVFIVSKARAVGVEAGDPILSVIDTEGNPYMLARSADGNRLFVCDGGSWKDSTGTLPDGSVRSYNVTSRTAPVLTPTTPTTVGRLPVLAYDAATLQGWGTNSSFAGVLQSTSGRCVVTNAASHTLSVLGTTNLNVIDTVDVGVTGGSANQLTSSTPTPFGSEHMFVQTVSLPTVDVPATTTEYFLHRITAPAGQGLTKKGIVQTPVQFFPVFPSPNVHARNVWPHPDGERLVLLPALGATLAVWNPASGGIVRSVPVQGGGAPTSLALNDVTGLLYVRESDGGWTVFSVSADGATPAEVKRVEDATGLDGLRVIGDGTSMAATGRSVLALIDAAATGTGAHTVRATVPLPLDSLGGSPFPQPGVATEVGAARTFVTTRGTAAGPQIVHPIAGTPYAAADGPEAFEYAGVAVGLTRRLELEIGTQRDFITGPGNARVRERVPVSPAGGGRSGAVGDGETITPSVAAWRRVLAAAAKLPSRRFYVRINEVRFGGTRRYGDAVSFLVEDAVPCEAILPAPNASATATASPVFEVGAEDGSRVVIEFASDDEFARRAVVRGRLPGVVGDGSLTGSVPAGAWRRAVARARRATPDAPAITVFWRARCTDTFGRVQHTEDRALIVPRD